MTYPDRYAALVAQRAYARRVACGGLVALLEPYTQEWPVVVVPAQRRRLCGRRQGGE